VKKLLFVQSRPPHGTLFGQEGLDAILMGTAFATCSVLLLDDGIYQLLRNQDSRALGTKDYSVTYQALKDYGAEGIYCSQRHLDERGLTVADLLVPVTPLSDQAVRQLMIEHDSILDF
jgi:tRNA 2-thiouridine synthesizing protein C